MFHIKVNVAGVPILKKKFIELCNKSRFGFNVCYIKLGEYIGTDEIHNIREINRMGYYCISKNWEGIYLDFHFIYFVIICSI